MGIVSSVFLSLLGCKPKPAAPPSPKPAAVRFPALVVTGTTSVRICRDDSQLRNAHVNHVILNREEPRLLIDAGFAVYRMNNLRSTKGGMWLMMNPSGTTPIAFDLEPHDRSGPAAARDIIAACQYLGGGSDESDEKRRRIAQEQTMEGIVRVLEEEAAPNAEPR